MRQDATRSRGRRRASAAVMAELREMFSGDVLREVLELEDMGEVMLTVIGNSEGGNANEPHSDGRDVWTHATEPLELDRPHHARLYHPAGIVFRAPKNGETAHLLRPKSKAGCNSPGFGLLLPDGGDGSASFLPSWYGDGDSGMYTQGEHLHLESKDKDIYIDAGGAEIHISGGGGQIDITAKAGALVTVNGNAQSAVRGEDLETWLVAHTHPTPVGPSGPPVEVFTPTILSSKVKLS